MEIYKALTDMKSSQCDMSPNILKLGYCVLPEPLAHVINSLLLKAIFPTNFKFMKVIHVYKE